MVVQIVFSLHLPEWLRGNRYTCNADRNVNLCFVIWGLLIRKGVCSQGSKCVPVRIDCFQKGLEVTRILSLISLVQNQACIYSYSSSFSLRSSSWCLACVSFALADFLSFYYMEINYVTSILYSCTLVPIRGRCNCKIKKIICSPGSKSFLSE